MKKLKEFEMLLEQEILSAADKGPEALKCAMEYAVFPGGGRVRPRLGLSIALALGREADDAVWGAVMAVELIHCASLVHDDLPCFDNADTRRGKPSVHRVFGQNTAVLVGDGLISAAFGVLAKYTVHRPELTGKLVAILSESLGASEGLVAGQASEEDLSIDVSEVHRKKTGALFEAVAAMTAVAAGVETTGWRRIGRRIGEAYQVADDILDASGDAAFAGKPVSQDARHERPSAVIDESLVKAAMRLDDLIESAVRSIPPCPGRDRLAAMLIGIATRLCPPTRVRRESRLMGDLGLSEYAQDADLAAVG